MTPRRRPRVAIAVIRAVVEPGTRPVIRILAVQELFHQEHDVTVTASPVEAADVVRAWLEQVVTCARR